MGQGALAALEPLSEFAARAKAAWARRSRKVYEALGGAQRLLNGNTLIANSHRGEAFEVTPEGEVVWKFITPHQNYKHQRAAFVGMKRYDSALIERLLASRVSG